MRHWLTVVCGLVALVQWPGVRAEELHSAVRPQPRRDKWWLVRNQQIQQRVKLGRVELIFIGDSITNDWDFTGKPIWDKYYRGRKAANLGIGGDRTQNVLWRLKHGNLEGVDAKVAVVMIGTNNSHPRENSAEQIAQGITAIVKTIRSAKPRTKILLLAIFPRGKKPNARRGINAQASRLAARLADGKNVHYMDLGIHFLGPDGSIAKEIMPDYLHLSLRGYEMWAIAIEGKLRELMGARP